MDPAAPWLSHYDDGVPATLGTYPDRTLVDYLAAGQRLDEFLEDFPTVHREAAVGVLYLAAALVVN